MSRLACVFLTFFFLFSPRLLMAGSPVVITEFMASNTRTLFDEDGDASDWIELANVSSTNVNLAGWTLTDDAGNRSKWTFPSTNLAAGQFLVVFASNKDRKVPGRNLHTNFRLSADGDYLALFEPDHLTAATAFAPAYPQQVPNVSFGFGLISSNSTLVGLRAPVKWLVPTSADDARVQGDAWRGGQEAFVDDDWGSGVTGLGFSAPGAPLVVASTSLVVRFNFDAPPQSNVILDTKGTFVLNGRNLGAAWVPSSTDNAPVPVTRSGVMEFSAVEGDQINAPANAAFNATNGTIVFWMRSTGPGGAGSGPGTLFDRRSGAGNPSTPATGAILVQELDGRLTFQAFNNGPLAVSYTTSATTSDDRWHLVALSYSQMATGYAALYLDGVLEGSVTNSRAWTWTSGLQVELGRSHETSFRKFNGLLDDFRFYNRALASEEVAQIFQGDDGVSAADIATNLQTAMLGVNASAFVRIPFTVADPDAFSLLTLRMRNNDGFAAWINGHRVASANVPESLTWNSAAPETNSSSLASVFLLSPLVVDEESGVSTNLLKSGSNVLAIQGLNVDAADPTFLILPELIGASIPATTTNPVYFASATPGDPNAGGAKTPGPVISGVEHQPQVPDELDNLVVTAQVAPSFGEVTNVLLRYRINYGAEVSVAMKDNGADGDTLAGDGIFTAIIPESASTNGQMIRYYVTAQDVLGNSSRWPLFYSPTNSAEYLGTVVRPSYVSSQLPIYHLFLQSPAAAETETGTRGSFFYDDEFYDNIWVAFRGNSSASFLKKAHRLEFNRDHRLRHSPDYPRIGNTSLLGEFADPAYFRQAFSFWLLEAFGTPSPFSYPVRVQLNGAFWQLALHSDVMGQEQLARMGYDPEGALYKAVGLVTPDFSSTGGFDKKTRLFEDRTDYLELANGINEARPMRVRATNAYDMVDLPNVINYLTVARWTQEADDVWANMTLYRDTLGDGLWRIIPFDMNVSWGQLYCGDNSAAYNRILATADEFKSHPLYGGGPVSAPSYGNSYNRLNDVIVQVPEFREMLLRRMRTLMDTWVQPEDTHPLVRIIEQRITVFTNLVWNEAFLDRQKWGWPQGQGPYCFGLNQYLTNHVPDIINQFIVPRRHHWLVTHCITNNDPMRPIGVNWTNRAGIPLSQPVDAAVDVLNVEFNPVSGNQAEEFICLTNPNPYAVDLSGWKLEKAVNFTFKGGTVMPSNSVLYVSPNIRAFRDRAVGPRGHMALFVVGPYQGQLSARGEPIVISNERGRIVYTNVYEGAPSLAQQFLRVTEIMYNPSPFASADAQEFEYVELKNISDATNLSLLGVHFVNGIQFDFSSGAITNLGPGERVLVVRNVPLFKARFGANLPVAGSFLGALDNGGERLQLLDAVDEEILDFSYNNSWYPLTDGLGFSLVVVDERAQPERWSDRSSWRASGAVNGSPGANDSTPPTFVAVLINEILSHTDNPPPSDSVELFNPTSSEANIGGWFLTDDFNTPKKFRIPDNTTIPAGGYRVFNEMNFNPRPGVPPSFSFSARGDEVWLFSGDTGTNLTGYVTGWDFDAQESGVSFGRYLTHTGEERLVAQSTMTLGATNAGPRVGPVVISEIMYHPPDQSSLVDNAGLEFVELRNLTSNDVDLFDSASRTQAWQITGGIDYVFPTNVTMAASNSLLLVSFSPTNLIQLDAFRAYYGLATNVPVYGPYTGKLANNSDRVELRKPDLSGAAEVSYVLVDAVSYADAAPWPEEADGQGASLHRLALFEYGDDAFNWTAAMPTPGTDFVGGAGPVITMQPTGGDVPFGSRISLQVIATGPSPLRYQWRANGLNLAGATNAELVLPQAQLDQAGFYEVTVFNGGGAVVSSNAYVNLLLPLFVSQPPQDQFVKIGSNATFTVAAHSPYPIRYQWRYQDVNIPGATETSLNLTEVDLTKAGEYSVVINDSINSLTAKATLVVLVPPLILQSPLSAVVTTGATVTLSVTVSNSATFPLTFRWRRNGAIVNTASLYQNNCFLTLNNVQTPGSYTVIVTNLANLAGVTSQPAVITIVADVDRDKMADFWETEHKLDPGTPADAALDADGDGMSNLQEYIAGTDPNDASSYLKLEQDPGRNPALLRFEAISNRTYTVEWKESINYGRWTKLQDVAAGPTNRLEIVQDPYPPADGRLYRLLTPRQPDPAPGPLILSSPQSLRLDVGEDALLQVFAVGTEPLRYQWLLNGKLISGATSSSLVIHNAEFSDGGAYSIRVVDKLGTRTNQPPALVALRPLIVGQPQSQTVVANDQVTFEVNALGVEPLRYQWRYQGKSLLGETNATLVLPDIQADQAGKYQVLVSHQTALGRLGVFSSNAVLTVR